MSDDPFAEPTDTDATLIRPRPGARTASAAAGPGSIGRCATCPADAEDRAPTR